MSRVRKKDWEIAERKIFLILFEEEKQFFLNDSTQKSIWDYYDSHYRERNSCTKNLFAERKRSGKELPPMFCLDTVIGNTNDAFQVKLAWSLYLKNQGYQTLMGKQMRCIVNGFAEHGNEYYERIKEIPLSVLCDAEKNLVAEFRNINKLKRTSNTRLQADRHRISAVVGEKTYLKIKDESTKRGISMSQYIEECVNSGGVLEVDTSFMENHTRDVFSMEKMLNGLIATYLAKGFYYPADIERVQELRDQVVADNAVIKDEIARLFRWLRCVKNGEL